MIRNIEAEDIPELVQLGFNMAKESDYVNDGYDFDKVEDLFDQVIQEDRFCGAVSVSDVGEIRGMFVGMLTEQFFSNNTLTTDLFLYVKPEYRGKRDGYQLIINYLEWAKEIGADTIMMGITTGIHEEKTGELYKKLGFCYCGSLYRQRP
jgi:GNAT superfamily N-acetyltransferase